MGRVLTAKYLNVVFAVATLLTRAARLLGAQLAQVQGLARRRRALGDGERHGRLSGGRGEGGEACERCYP
jgi:hypothetical protein